MFMGRSSCHVPKNWKKKKALKGSNSVFEAGKKNNEISANIVLYVGSANNSGQSSGEWQAAHSRAAVMLAPPSPIKPTAPIILDYLLYGKRLNFLIGHKFCSASRESKERACVKTSNSFQVWPQHHLSTMKTSFPFCNKPTRLGVVNQLSRL